MPITEPVPLRSFNCQRDIGRLRPTRSRWHEHSTAFTCACGKPARIASATPSAHNHNVERIDKRCDNSRPLTAWPRHQREARKVDALLSSCSWTERWLSDDSPPRTCSDRPGEERKRKRRRTTAGRSRCTCNPDHTPPPQPMREHIRQNRRDSQQLVLRQGDGRDTARQLPKRCCFRNQPHAPTVPNTCSLGNLRA